MASIRVFELLKQRVPIGTLGEEHVGTTVVVSGWAVTLRPQKKMMFFKLSDDCKTKLDEHQLQIVVSKGKIDQGQSGAKFADLTALAAGCSILVVGKFVKSPGEGQPVEIDAEEIHILGVIKDPTIYPLAKGTFTMDRLRGESSHLECHHPTKAAIYRIRSELSRAYRTFFESKGFTEVRMPAITFSECEGGCQPMQATLLLTSGKKADIPVKDGTDFVDFSKDFFGQKACLTVSSQLELETQLPLGPVYCTTIAFRGEPSQTSRHLCEFSMIEIEMPFTSGASDIADMTEECIMFCVDWALKECQSELKFLETFFGKSHIGKLIHYRSQPFARTTHAKVVEMIQQDAAKDPTKFKEVPSFSDDLSSEHERYVTDLYGLPVIVCRYPKAVKAFYMPVVEETLEESHGVEHVDCFDILVPDVGELVGGSQRIHDDEALVSRIRELGMDPEPLEFYVDLRRTGTQPHGGMGMGFERLVKFITGADSVKDCVSFPRFIGSGKRS